MAKKLRKVLPPAKSGSVSRKKVNKAMAAVKQEKHEQFVRDIKKLVKHYEKKKWHSIALKIEEVVAKFEGREFP